MTGAQQLAAVAATGQIWGLKSWWYTEAEEPDIWIPADAFRKVIPTYGSEQLRVHL